MSSIEASDYSAWVTVQTTHGERLEFILHEAEERLCKKRGHYANLLAAEVDKALDGSQAWVKGTQSYGYEMLLIAAPTLLGLQAALDLIVEPAVASWVRKYNIEAMKDSPKLQLQQES